MKKQEILLLLLCLLFVPGYGQDTNPLFTRLRAISNGEVEFFNVDGFEITVQTESGEFSKKNVYKKFKKYPIKESDLSQSDTSIGYQNFYIAKSEEAAPGVKQNVSYYFMEIPGTGIRAVAFASFNKTDPAFEKEFLTLFNTGKIPRNIYEQVNIDSIDFAGRKLALGNSCRWMGVNNVQCPYYGQMNWSVHKNSEDAATQAENQYKIIQAKRYGKIVSEELVDVVFEGNEVKAKRIVYDLKGVKSLLAGMTGGKTLTIYFVAAPVRQNFISCVMSFWNNDAINPSGLPPLLDQVMKLKK